MDVSIVIVNWNSGDYLRACVESIPAARLPHGWRLAAVLVIDNASSDGSCDLPAPAGLPLTVIRNSMNRGFAAACNQGAAACASDLILFLNPDARLFHDSLQAPIEHLSHQWPERVGIASIQLVDETGAVARCCARFPRAYHFLAQAVGVTRLLPSTSHLMCEWPHDSTRKVDQVIGAFFMIRRDLFESLCGFDERFFVYFEEVDLAWRAYQLGWASVFIAQAQAFHAGGGTSNSIKGRRLFYSLRSRLHYGAKHYAWPERTLLWLVSLVIEPVARAVHLLAARRFADLAALAEGYGLLLRDAARRCFNSP